MTRPDGTTPIVGDDDGGRALPLTSDEPDDFRGTLAAGADLLARGDLKYTPGNDREESFWLLGRCRRSYIRIEGEEPAEASAQFPSGGYFVMRDGWLDTDNYLLVDCGPVGSLSGGHGHADALSIEVAIQGKPLLVDSGTYSYHESPEIRSHFRSTVAHNTLMVDEQSSSEPGGTFNWRSRADAKVNAWVTDVRFDYFSGEHDGYRRLEGEPIHERSVLFLKNDYIIIRDLVRTHGEHTHSLNFHFAADVKVAVGPDFVSGDDWRIFTFDNGGHWQKRESWISNIYGRRWNSPFLQYISNGRGKQEFLTFILPAGGSGGKAEVSELPIEGARAFAILFGDYTDVLICNDGLGNTISTELIDTNFEFTWTRVGARADTPEEFVLIGGSRFALGGCDVLDGDREIGFATIRQIGSDLNVNTENGRFRITMP